MGQKKIGSGGEANGGGGNTMPIFAQAPLTPLELWQIVAVVIATLFVAVVAMVGLWTLFGPDSYRENRRLSGIQHMVRWLSRHGKAWRIL